MKITKLIEVLVEAHRKYGDVEVLMMNEETGDWHPLRQVGRRHPHTGKYGCLNRSEPVDGVTLFRVGGCAPDLVEAED